MDSIFKAIRETMAAVAFAEANEQESARDFLHTTKNAHKKIVLGTDEPLLAPRAVTYAMNICARLGAGLEIIQILPSATLQELVVEQEKNAPTLQEIKQGFARRGILYNFFFGTSSLDEEISRHTARRRDIMLYVFKMSGRQENQLKTEKELVGRFQCPVVLLDEALPA